VPTQPPTPASPEESAFENRRIAAINLILRTPSLKLARSSSCRQPPPSITGSLVPHKVQPGPSGRPGGHIPAIAAPRKNCPRSLGRAYSPRQKGRWDPSNHPQPQPQKLSRVALGAAALAKWAEVKPRMDAGKRRAESARRPAKQRGSGEFGNVEQPARKFKGPTRADPEEEARMRRRGRTSTDRSAVTRFFRQIGGCSPARRLDD
jgi:hypothetical protein